MKKTIAAIFLLFSLTACVSGETEALEQIASNTAETSSERPVVKPQPLRVSGRTWQEHLAFHNVHVSENYLGQVCNYTLPAASDNYLSKSELDPIALKIFYDNDSKYNSDQLAAIFVAAAMAKCPHIIPIVQGS